MGLVKRFSLRHSSINWPHTALIARPLSRRKLAIVLKSGTSRPVNHIDVAQRFPLEAAARLQAVEVAVEIDLEQRRGMVGRAAAGAGAAESP